MKGPIDKLEIDKQYANGSGKFFGIWLGLVYAIVIGGRVISHSESEGMVSTGILIFAIIWPLGYFIVSQHRFVPGHMKIQALLAIIVFLVFCLLSAFNSPIAIQSAAFAGLTLVTIVVALQFATCMTPKDLEIGLKVYATIICSVLTAFAVYDYVPGTRLGGGREIMNPNAIALVSLSAGLATMAIRTWILRYGLIALTITIIYLTGSRASAIALILGLGVTGYKRTRVSGRRTKLFVVALIIIGCTAMTIYWDDVWPQLEGFLQLHSRHRGLASGASGRSIVWNETWQLFLDNPVFGIGFRAHEAILGISAHNGYLATLAEIGLAGFLAILYLIAYGLYNLRKQVKRLEYTYSYSILLGLVVSYLFVAIFERFLINVGNPTSILFLFSILLPTLKPKTKKDSNAKKYIL